MRLPSVGGYTMCLSIRGPPRDVLTTEGLA
jgi:hypothetical protein